MKRKKVMDMFQVGDGQGPGWQQEGCRAGRGWGQATLGLKCYHRGAMLHSTKRNIEVLTQAFIHIIKVQM